ncbi:site-specific integrase [Paenibacillus sepulcri]|uniref:site-specific integrase n=1 Tax=Paenibacillus sepulcri TaxID=359917 RepID=UPI0035E4ACA0
MERSFIVEAKPADAVPQPYRRMLASRTGVGDAIAFAPFHRERPYLWFRQLIKKNGFQYIRFHGLRHTSATLLINQGVHAKIISERLGHGSISTTMNIYGHALQSADQAAADKFESLFSN